MQIGLETGIVGNFRLDVGPWPIREEIATIANIENCLLRMIGCEERIVCFFVQEAVSALEQYYCQDADLISLETTSQTFKDMCYV